MPTRLRYFLDRLPLPSLRTYTVLSTSLLLANVCYFHHLIQSNADEIVPVNDSNTSNESSQNQSIPMSDMEVLSLAYGHTLLSTVLSQSLSLLVCERSSWANANHSVCV